MTLMKCIQVFTMYSFKLCKLKYRLKVNFVIGVFVINAHIGKLCFNTVSGGFLQLTNAISMINKSLYFVHVIITIKLSGSEYEEPFFTLLNK